MSLRQLFESANWPHVGKTVLRHALNRTGWLLLQGSQLERFCGEQLQQLSIRLDKPDK